MLVKLVEIRDLSGPSQPSISEIYINPSHIISVTEVVPLDNSLTEAKKLGLVDGVRFSKIVLSEGSNVRTLTVIGAPYEVQSKVKKKQILRG